jgi:mono/diheme cytochrome c family protein
MKSRATHSLALFLLAWLLVTCGSARRGEPLTGPFPIHSEEVAHGQRIFMAVCHQCHPGGENGLGPALNDKPIPEFVIRYQVRHGLGAMPAFSEEQISEKDLDHVIAYLKRLRSHS